MDMDCCLPSVCPAVAGGRYVNAILTTRMKGGLAQKAVGSSVIQAKGKREQSREHKGGNGKVQEVIQGERHRW